MQAVYINKCSTLNNKWYRLLIHIPVSILLCGKTVKKHYFSAFF